MIEGAVQQAPAPLSPLRLAWVSAETGIECYYYI
jgi:hypothetical protein